MCGGLSFEPWWRDADESVCGWCRAGRGRRLPIRLPHFLATIGSGKAGRQSESRLGFSPSSPWEKTSRSEPFCGPPMAAVPRCLELIAASPSQGVKASATRLVQSPPAEVNPPLLRGQLQLGNNLTVRRCVT